MTGDLTDAQRRALEALDTPVARRYGAKATVRTDADARPVWVNKRAMHWLAGRGLVEERDRSDHGWYLTRAGELALAQLDAEEAAA